jgi:hypothetical protein
MRTPEAILSWPELFVPKSQNPTEKAKYSATLVFLEGTDLSEMKQEAMKALCEKFKLTPEAAAAEIADGELAWPFLDKPSKIEKKGYPEGSTAVNVKTYNKPGIVTQYADPVTGKPTPIQSEEDAKYGSVVMATVNVNAYDKKGNKGVSFWLNNMQIRGHSDVLGGGPKAEDEFEADAATVDLPDEPVEDSAVEAPAAGNLDSLLS